MPGHVALKWPTLHSKLEAEGLAHQDRGFVCKLARAPIRRFVDGSALGGVAFAKMRHHAEPDDARWVDVCAWVRVSARGSASVGTGWRRHRVLITRP